MRGWPFRWRSRVLDRESQTLRIPEDTYEVEEDCPGSFPGRDVPGIYRDARAPSHSAVHNAVDSCCFRRRLVKPGVYDAIKPFFKLYGKADNLAWHENSNPGVHNYQLDNRQQAYRFFTEHFHMPIAEREIFSDNDIRTTPQLAIG